MAGDKVKLVLEFIDLRGYLIETRGGFGDVIANATEFHVEECIEESKVKRVMLSTRWL